MKMVFFSADKLEVERLRHELVHEGIECEIREGLPVEEGFVAFRETELWVQNDADVYRALMLCVERETGFGKKAFKPLTPYDLWDEVLAA